MNVVANIWQGWFGRSLFLESLVVDFQAARQFTSLFVIDDDIADGCEH